MVSPLSWSFSCPPIETRNVNVIQSSQGKAETCVKTCFFCHCKDCHGMGWPRAPGSVEKNVAGVFCCFRVTISDWSILLRGVFARLCLFFTGETCWDLKPWYPMLVTSRVEAVAFYRSRCGKLNAANNGDDLGIMRFDGNSPCFSSNLINSSGCQHFPSIKTRQWCQFKIWSLVPQKLIMESL